MKRTAIATLVVGLLAGCGTATEPSDSAATQTDAPSASTSAAPASSDSPTVGQSAAATPSTSTAAPKTNLPAMTLAEKHTFTATGISRKGPCVSVKVGRNDGFDRVVYQFKGPEVPLYWARYVSTPIQDPTGDPVKVAGSAFLELDLGGVDMYDVPPAKPSVAGTSLAQVNTPGHGFEGTAQVFIGLTGKQRPFRVFTLKSPSRLVIDIATP